MDSILTSIKKLLGVTEEYEVFDNDIIIYINTAFSALTQLGVGPASGFFVTDETAKWSDYLKDNKKLEAVKTFVYLKVKLLFDPPASSSVLESYNRMLSEMEWRINLTAEEIGPVSISIVKNGTYDVSDYDIANVEIELPDGTYIITSSGIYDITKYEKVIVDIPKPIGTLDITENGKHDVTDYAEVNVDIQSSSSNDTLKSLLDVTKTTYNMFKDSTTSTIDGLIPYDSTSNVTNMSYMFNNCPNLTSVPLFDTSNATNMSYMFNNCPNLTSVPLFGTTNVTNMTYMFNKCTNLTTVPLFDTSNVENMSYMFVQCSNLTTVPLFDTSNVTTMTGMFNVCTNLTTVPLFDTSNVTGIDRMFYNCSNLTTVPLFDTRNATNMTYMFYNCLKLTSVPSFDTTNVTNMSNMFNKCPNLTSALFPNTSNVTNMSNIFNGCTNLTDVTLDMNGVTNTSYANYMFSECASLTNLTLYNIKVDLQIGYNTGYGQFLTKDSLVHTCKECIKPSSGSRKLTVSNNNKNILDSVYVKFTDSSVNSIASGEKGDVVECESTDEGAMTISAYMSLKSWSIK